MATGWTAHPDGSAPSRGGDDLTRSGPTRGPITPAIALAAALLLLTLASVPAAASGTTSCDGAGDAAHLASCDAGATETCCADGDAALLDTALALLDRGDGASCGEVTCGPGCDDALTVLNPQSQPSVGGEWEIRFETEGTGDLRIRPTDGTTWSNDSTADVEPLSLRSGGEAVEYEWRNGSIVARNYSSSDTGRLLVTPHTSGKHHLKLTFDGDTEYAHNNASAEWYDSNWNYRKNLTVDSGQVAADLTSFPVLVDITDADLAAKAQSDGDDILFTSADGTTQLDHEVESYDSSTGHLVAWVERDLSGSTDTEIYLYYNNSAAANQENASGVWDTTYSTVYHMDETSGDETDSTSNNHDSTVSVTSRGVTGQIGDAYSFNSDDAHLEDADAENYLNDPTAITGSVWVKSDVTGTDNGIWIADTPSGSDKPFALRYDSDGASGGQTNVIKTGLEVDGTEQNVETSGSDQTTNWQHLVFTWSSGSGQKVYINGAQDSLSTGDATASGSLTGATTLFVGRGPKYGSPGGWDGEIDEFRVSTTELSSSWISTEYNNQNDPAAFITVGTEETSGPAPTLQNLTPTDGSTVDPNTDLSVDAYATKKPFNVSFYWGNDTLIEAQTGLTTNGTVTSDPGTMTVGEHSWYATATNANGTTTTSSTQSFTALYDYDVSAIWNSTADWDAGTSDNVEHSKDPGNLSLTWNDLFEDGAIGSEWSTTDNDGETGTSFSESGGNLDIYTAGNDGSDEYSAVYTSYDGNVSAVLKITSMDYNSGEQTGIAFRNDMTASGTADNGYVGVFANDGSSFSLEKDSDSDGVLEQQSTGGTYAEPSWVKLEKNGTTFTAYYATTDPVNGTGTWTEIGSTTVSSATTTQDLGIHTKSNDWSDKFTASHDYFLLNPGNGTHTTAARDFGTAASLKQITVDASLPSGTGINATIQTSTDNATWTDASTVALEDGNNTYPLSGSGQYVQVKTEFNTTDQTLNPQVHRYKVMAKSAISTSNPGPSDGAGYVKDTQNISIDVNSTNTPFDVSFYWSDDTLIESVTGIGSNGTVEVDPGTLSLGTHQWYVNASDEEGNSTVSSTYSFTVVPQHNVSVTNQTSSRNAAKGQTVQYTIDVKNTGWANDTYNVTVSENTDKDFTANVSPETLTVTSGSTGSVTLNVTAPDSGSLPMETLTTVQATSTNDSAVTGSTTVETRVGQPDLDNPRRYRLEFGENWSEPYHITNVSWTPRVWLYDQNGNPVPNATVSYSLVDINDNRELEKPESSGTATDLGDGSYNFSYTVESWDEEEYEEIEFTVDVNGTTLKEERIYFSNSRDSGYEVPYRFEWDDQTDGPTMLGGANKTVNVELHDHTGGLHPGATVTLDVYDDTGSSVHSGTMTDNGDGSYSYTVPDTATTAGNDYHFQVSTSYSSAQTDGYTGYVTSSRYIRAIDTDYNIPSIWDVELDPFLPTEEDNVSIDAKMSDDAELNVTRIEYRLNHGPWQYEDLTNTEGSSYTVDLGSYHQEDRIDWKLYAEDTSGNYNETDTDIIWISTPTTNASSAKMFLDQDVYMFGYSSTADNKDDDGVIWPDQNDAPTGGSWEKQIIEKNTIRATALVLDDRGKPKQTISPNKLNFWITNDNGKKIVINSTTNSDHLRNVSDGRYVAVFQGSQDANENYVDPMADDIWGHFTSGTTYNVSVSVDGDFTPEDKAPFLAYSYGDAYWQTNDPRMDADHCETVGCHGSYTYDSDPHQGDAHGLKDMWAYDNVFDPNNENLPTCGMCHGTRNPSTWDKADSRAHPRPGDANAVNHTCVNADCHGQGWDYTTANNPPIDMPVPNYLDGTYNVTQTDDDGTERTKETYAPDFCSNCHQFPSGIKPPEGGHNDYVGCKFCHQNFHTINDPQKKWDPDTDTGTPGYASNGYDGCWEDCHQSVEPHAGTVMCAECHEGMSEEPQHEDRMHVKGKGTGTKETSYEFCGHCHQNDSYDYKGISPPQVPDPIQHGNGSSWNSSMGYDDPYWGDVDMACRYCHGRTYNQDPPTGRVEEWMGDNEVGMTASETTFCSGCHRANYSSGYNDYTDMLHAYNSTTGEIAPEAFGNQTWAPLTDPDYLDMDTYDIDKKNYTDAYCVDCHVMGGEENTLMKNFVHNVTTDDVPPEVETWTLDPSDVTDTTSTTVNVTAHVEDPQGTSTPATTPRSTGGSTARTTTAPSP